MHLWLDAFIFNPLLRHRNCAIVLPLDNLVSHLVKSRLFTDLTSVPLQTLQTECVRARQKLGLFEVFQADSALRQGRHSSPQKVVFKPILYPMNEHIFVKTVDGHRIAILSKENVSKSVSVIVNNLVIVDSKNECV